MILGNLPTLTFFYILLVYFIGGITQGILGVGLITVVISLLSFVVDVKETIALVIIPTIITSFFQMINGNNLRKITIDTKFFLIFSTLIIIPGAILLKTLQSDLILIFIAILLFVNSTLFFIFVLRLHSLCVFGTHGERLLIGTLPISVTFYEHL